MTMIIKEDWIACNALLTYDMPCDCKTPKALNVGKLFPQRLQEAHGGKIAICVSSTYKTSKAFIDVGCTVCGHEWSTQANHLVNDASGCPACSIQRCMNNAGKTRKPRASEQEKEYARFLRYVKGWSYNCIARFLGRSDGSIISLWCDHERAERRRQTNAIWKEQNRERHRAGTRRYFKEFSHGRASRRSIRSKRRSLEIGALFTVEIDGEFHDVDMYEYLRDDPVGREIFTDATADQAWKDLSTRAEKLGKIAGTPYQIDHLQPLSRGGCHSSANFSLRPASENMSKGNKLIPYDQSLFAKRLFGIIPGYERCVCLI